MFDEGEELGGKLAKIWLAYDQLPAEQKTKARLGAASDASADLIQGAPAKYKPALVRLSTKAFRKRMAPLVRPPTHITGDEEEIRVPSDKLSEGLMWGSMRSKGETAEAMRSMGFEEIRRANGRTWEL